MHEDLVVIDHQHTNPLLPIIVFWVGLPDRHDAVDSIDEGVQEMRLELAVAEAIHDGDRLVEREGGSIYAVARERIENVGDGRDPGLLRDLLAPHPAGVAAAVPPLVM